MLENLAFRGFSCGPLKGVIGVKILASRIVLRIYYKSSTKYLATEDVAEGIAKGSRLGAEPKAKDL